MAEEMEFQTQLLKSDETGDVVSLRKCQLIVVEGKDKGKKYSLVKPITEVGKKDDNDFIVSDKTVSRNHLSIEYASDSFLLKDNQSTNGTFLNGNRVKEAYLAPGDHIQVGETTLEFHVFDEKVKIEPSANDHFGSMVGKSKKMRQIFGIFERIAGTNATVILEGETGTGKDVAARAIHEGSSRKNKPFVVFDCSAVAPNLIESELFGHERGAFTGAVKARRGAFEEASGGTIFLDEIGELSLDLQPKLLRALEQREIKRVGANTPAKIDVRVICATNRNLKKEVTEGRFREDLYYRLSVVKIVIPPLRERVEDIPAIIQVFLEKSKMNQLDSGDLKITRVEDDALKVLQRYQWPGNVRELQNIVERATAIADGNVLNKTHIDFVFEQMEDEEEMTERLSVDTDLPFKEAKQKVVEVFERDYLIDLLRRNGYNLSAAAREAKIDRKHIRNLLKKYGIPTKDE
jgi:transcriptional regulator with GAF, ATPase, and Fis domain